MPEKEREIVRMWHNGASAKEIAELLGIDVQQVVSVVVGLGIMEI